jgi:hypothetical protein
MRNHWTPQAFLLAGGHHLTACSDGVTRALDSIRPEDMAFHQVPQLAGVPV